MRNTEIEIIRRAESGSKEFVTAALLDGLRPTDLDLIERVWGPERSRILLKLMENGAQDNDDRPESLHWDWSKKSPELKLLEANGFAVVCEEQWQGVMMTKSASYSSQLKGDIGKPLVYVDYLEVAPWNWKIPAIKEASLRSLVLSF